MPDLDEQVMEQAEVAARDTRDRGHGLGIGEVGLVEGKPELPPVAGEHEGEFVALQGAVVMSKADAAESCG